MVVSIEQFKKAFNAAAAKALADARESRVDEAIEAMTKEADKLEALGFGMQEIRREAENLLKRRYKADEIKAESQKYKALEGLRKEADDTVAHIRSLTKALGEVMGKSDGKPTDDQKSAAYKKAIEERYGISIEVPKGMKNTHFDQMFDMFGSVPPQHTAQKDLKKLVYAKPGKDSGSASYNKDTAKIKMGDFGDATGKENYHIGDKVIPANSFNVTALHEIGHAVDHRNNVMGSNMDKSGCGAWRTESIDSIADVLAKHFIETDKPKKISKEKATEIISETLTDGKISEPWFIDKEEWKKLESLLTIHCLPMLASKKPWRNQPPAIGGRVYQQSYSDGRWASYALSERGATEVNSYQWRAPGEWFAEIYAITWLSKKKPPGGVAPAVAKFMWQG